MKCRSYITINATNLVISNARVNILYNIKFNQLSNPAVCYATYITHTKESGAELLSGGYDIVPWC